jgi:2-hydroxychromene-2-carboxylate isomerase
VFDEPVTWQPILLGGLFKIHGRDSWGNGPGRADGIAEVERRATAYGLPAIRWPDPWPGNMLTPMRAATFAKQVGKVVSFSLAAFRQAYAAGRDLGDPDSVVLAAAACELHPDAVLKAVETRAVKDELRAATEAAAERGVIGVPSVAIGDQVLWGDDRLEEAAALAN